MKTITKVDTWLPVFSGFYGTMWETDSDEESEIDYINETRKEKGLPEIGYDDIDWAYDEYQKDAVEDITDSVGDKLKEGGYIKSFKLQKLNSPREYNFANDSIDVAFVLNARNKKAITAYLQAHKPAFAQYLYDHYTSRSGFYSFHSNDMYVWLQDLEGVLADDHKLGAVLNFILLNEDKDLELEIYEDLHGNGLYLQAKNYLKLTGGK